MLQDVASKWSLPSCLHDLASNMMGLCSRKSMYRHSQWFNIPAYSFVPFPSFQIQLVGGLTFVFADIWEDDFELTIF